MMSSLTLLDMFHLRMKAGDIKIYYYTVEWKPGNFNPFLSMQSCAN